MYGHPVSKRRDLFGKGVTKILGQPVDPAPQRFLSRTEKPFRFGFCQLLREADRRQLCRVQDLVQIRIADPVKDLRIGESSFESPVFIEEPFSKLVEFTREHIQPASIKSGE